ncbi:MAG: hypothetical protein HQK51_15625 [Oligoflexia bacterium]|nr:hypothetical protein [Oligoflexia bacterium]
MKPLKRRGIKEINREDDVIKENVSQKIELPKVPEQIEIEAIKDKKETTDKIFESRFVPKKFEL